MALLLTSAPTTVALFTNAFVPLPMPPSIQATKDKIESCRNECVATRDRLNAEVLDKRRELDLCNTKIAALDDPEGRESAVAKYDAELARLRSQQREEEEEHVARKKAVADEIRNALTKAQEYEDRKKECLNNMNAHIDSKREECAKIKLLDS